MDRLTASLTFLAAMICLVFAKWLVLQGEWAKSLASIHTGDTSRIVGKSEVDAQVLVNDIRGNFGFQDDGRLPDKSGPRVWRKLLDCENC